jgi:putative ABC transport system permease protein
VVLGTAGAYLDDLGELGQVPVAHLTVTAIGVPLVAAGLGWLLAGRQPAAIAPGAVRLGHL